MRQNWGTGGPLGFVMFLRNDELDRERERENTIWDKARDREVGLDVRNAKFVEGR